MTVNPIRNTRNPDTGWTIWGQAKPVNELRNAVRTVPNHSYVFSGPAQSGKRATAIDFARALCCTNAPEVDSFCGECSTCRRIARGVFPDVTIVDLKTQAAREKEKSRNLTLNISTVREIGAAVAYRPSEASWRVVIVDDVETMQETAQEAFLKTLEEPPSYAVIILITSDVDSLLPTIRSRCVPIRFGPAPLAETRLSLEAAGADTHQADRIAVLSQGAIGWAFAASNEPSLIVERERRIIESLEFVSANGYDRIVRSISLADDFVKDREGVFANLHALQGVWRTALLAHLGVDPETGETLLGERAKDFRTIPLAEIVRSIRSIDACIANLEANVRPRLALESMVITWPNVTI
jgi:DNA polymerase-3 subunit delta'